MNDNKSIVPYKRPETRAELARRNHLWFHSIFLPHFVTYSTADFQKEMFQITEDDSIKVAAITAFRGSGKSTIMTLSYPIWSVVGAQRRKFVLLLAKTQSQAKIHFSNLKREFETNEMLRADLGPFEQDSDEWGQYSIVLPKYGARITAASSEQSIRGIRHGPHRPDLVVVDDPEDLQSVKTLEGRDKTWTWLTSEVIPIGDRSTKIIVVGNLLHEDSVMMRLKNLIGSGTMSGIYREYPLLNDGEVIAWPGKFPNMATVEELKKEIGNESAFQREYLLRIVTDEDQVIKPEWIEYYAGPPPESEDFRYAATGVDLAISEKSTADCTAMVSGRIHGHGDDLKVFILPHPVNERMDFPKTVTCAISLSKTLGGGVPTRLIIEEVGYQKAFIDHLKNQSFPAEGFRPQGQDKRERLSLVSHLVQQGKVLFPKKGAEQLVAQLVGFGKERHDDLADAFVILLLDAIGDDDPGFVFPHLVTAESEASQKNYSDLTNEELKRFEREADLELMRESEDRRKRGLEY